MEESILDEVSQLVEIRVVFSLLFAVFLRRDDRRGALLYGLRDDRVRIIGAISQKILCINSFDQGYGLLAICFCTFCNNGPERHAMRIHGQMQFCVEPPFVRLIAWLPPLAPAAWG